jgi:16S rRNA (uracil1498-N3)-methyltransferase
VLPRFFAPRAADAIGGVFELPRDEAHHASRVMRLSPGDEIAVFDGAGREWRARIEEARGDRVSVRLLDPLPSVPEPRVAIVLLHAVLKGDHMDAVVRDSTMIGAAVIRPMVTAHTIARAGGASAERLRERWMRVAVASAKQCRRAVVPDISRPVAFDVVLSSIGSREAGELRVVLAEPTAGAAARAPAAVSSPAPPKRAIMAVGPEGGWCQDELAHLRSAGFEPVSLGALTLRADAAALVAISAFRAVWQE